NILIDEPNTGVTSTADTINNNTLFHPSSQVPLSYWSDTNLCLQCVDAPAVGSRTITNNFVQGGYPAVSWYKSTNGTLTGNKLVPNSSGGVFGMQNAPLFGNGNYTVNSNSYWSGHAPLFGHVDSLGNVFTGDFTGWKSNTGWDGSSTYTSGTP